MNKRVVITGMGVVSSIGSNLDEFKASVYDIKSGITYLENLEKYGFGCRLAGIPDEKSSNYYPYIEKYKLSDAAKIIIYGVIAGLEAWCNGGLVIPEPNKGETDYDTGCIIGSGIGSPDIYHNKIIPYTNDRKIKYLKSCIVEKSMLSGISANLGWILGLGNQLSFNSSACATGLESIIMAYDRIKAGKATRMLAGASEADFVYMWATFDAMHVLTRKNETQPAKASCPMSAEASGFVPGAGAGVLLIEEYESALKRNARIYAEILAGNINSGGQRNNGTMTIPNTEGVIRCITQTILESGIDKNEIDYISGHLSSTIADPLEVKNWSDALNRQGLNFPYINSLKSLTGHCIGATGAIETIAAVLQLYHGFIHGNLNAENIHSEIEKIVDKTKIPLKTFDFDFNTLIKASFGFGDVNSCVIIKKIS